MENSHWILELQFWKRGNVVEVRHAELFFDEVSLRCLVVDHLRVDSALRHVVDVFAYEELVALSIEVRSLAFSLVVNPRAFKVISVSLGQNSVAVPLSIEPLADIDISVLVDHSSLTARLVVLPEAIVSMSKLAKL